jgi:hypothetical protein
MRERERYTSMSPDHMDALLVKKREYNKRKRNIVASNCNDERSPGIVHTT